MYVGGEESSPTEKQKYKKEFWRKSDSSAALYIVYIMPSASKRCWRSVASYRATMRTISLSCPFVPFSFSPATAAAALRVLSK